MFLPQRTQRPQRKITDRIETDLRTKELLK
jgi:hypothetical protein